MKKLLLSALVFTGCAHVQQKAENSVNLGRDVVMTLPEPKDILPEMTKVQMLSIEHQGKTRSSQVVLTNKANKLTVVALLPIGGEAFRVEYENGQIRTRSLPMGASQFDPKYALADLILVHASAAELRRRLPSSVKIEDSPVLRELILDAKPLVRIRYSSADKNTAAVDYENLARDYRIHIEPVQP